MADITKSVRDSVHISETCSRPSVSRAVTDSIATSGSATHYGDNVPPKTISEEISVGEVNIADTFNPKSVSESLTLTDQKTRQVNSNPPFSDSISISENISKTVIGDQHCGDTVVFDSAIRESATITINSPADNSEYLHGDSITFSGSAFDLISGNPVEDSDLAWVSNVEGIIGYGSEFSYSGLSSGVHVISLKAAGQVVSKSISITIFEDNSPDRPENLEEE